MTGFMKIKISKLKRALLTRTIAIIPSVIIAFLNKFDKLNDNLNIL